MKKAPEYYAPQSEDDEDEDEADELFDMTDERVLARGGVERIGSPESRCFVEVDGKKTESVLAAKDHAVAVRLCLKQLTESGCLASPQELSAIGFKQE